MSDKLQVIVDCQDEYGCMVSGLEWPDGWSIPPVGAEVTLKDGDRFKVAKVNWNIQGDSRKEPYIRIVLEAKW